MSLDNLNIRFIVREVSNVTEFPCNRRSEGGYYFFV